MEFGFFLLKIIYKSSNIFNSIKKTTSTNEIITSSIEKTEKKYNTYLSSTNQKDNSEYSTIKEGTNSINLYILLL